MQVDDAQAKTSIDDLKAGLELLGETHATATADVDAQHEALDMLKDELDTFAEEHKTAVADVDAQKGALDDLKADLDKFGAERATATADVNTEGTLSLDDLKLKLEEFGMMHKTATASIDTDTARSGLADLKGKAEEAAGGLNDVGGAGGGASGGLNSAGAAASNAGGGMGAFYAGVAILIGLLVALLPAMGGIVVGLMGFAAAAGVVLLALKPVITAVQDFTAAQQQSGQQSAQTAAQQQANATATANAQQAIVQAVQQANQTQITGAMQVGAAQQNLQQSYMSLASAQRTQAFQAAQSANSLVSAEQAVTNAQMADTQATQALTQARIAAQQAMQNLNNSVADGALSVRSAQLQLQQAQLNQQNLAPGASGLQRAQAQLAVDQAKQSIVDQQTRLQQLQQQQGAAQKAGIDGSTQVVAATNSVRLADLNVLNTERALQMARLTAANSAVSASDAVVRAQQNVAQSQANLQRAQEQAAFANQQATQRVSQAQQAYNNLLVQQRLQMAASAAASPYGKFQSDMANLAPPAQDLVKLLTQQKGLLTGLEKSAENSFLPGFNQFVKDGIASLPTLNGAISIFGTGFGNFMAKVGDWAATPFAQGQFNNIIRQAAGFMQDLGDATLQFLPAFTAGLVASAPATKAFGQGLGEIVGTGLPAMFRDAQPYIASASIFLRQFLGLISDLLPILVQMGGVMSEVFGAAMAPFRALVQAVAAALIPALNILAPIVGQMAAEWITDLIPAVKALTPFLLYAAIGLSEVLGWLKPMLPIIAPLVTGIWLMNAALAANPAIAIAAVIAILVGAIVYLATKTQLFQIVWRDVWNFAKQSFDDTVSFLRGPFGALVLLIAGPIGPILYLAANWQRLWTDVKQDWNAFYSWFSPVWTGSWNAVRSIGVGIWDGIQAAWNLFSGNFTGAVQKLVNGVKSIWNGIIDVFRTPVNAIIGIWNAVGGVLGLPHINPIGSAASNPAPVTPGVSVGGVTAGHGAMLAAGGHIRGPGSETSDSIPAWLSDNEYVMPAHAVKRWGVGFMDRVRGGGPQGDGHHFLFGGLVDVGKSLFNDAKGALASGWNALKSVAADAVYDVAKPIMDSVVNSIPHPIPGMGEPWGDVIYDIAKTAESDVLNMFKGKQDAAKSSGGVSFGGGAGSIPSGQHLALIDAAYRFAKPPSKAGSLPQWEAGMNTLINRESSWNSRAVNKSDTNATGPIQSDGAPLNSSRGLTQTIPATFRAYHAAGTSSDIYDPTANIAASMDYIVSRYNSILNVQQANSSMPPKGYALGVNSAPKGWAIVGEQGPEAMHFGGGETVRSFSDTMGAIGAGSAGMKDLVSAIANGNGAEVHVDAPITVYAGDGATAEQIVEEIGSELIPAITLAIQSGVGSK